jgi:hypothetical protein
MPWPHSPRRPQLIPTIKVYNHRTPSQSKHKQRKNLAEVIGTPRDNVISATRGRCGSRGLSMDACAEKEMALFKSSCIFSFGDDEVGIKFYYMRMQGFFIFIV